MTLTEAIFKVNEVMRAAGYPDARVEIHIALPDVDAAQREPEIGRMLIEEVFHPAKRVDPTTRRFLGSLYHVHIYTQQGP